MSEAEFWESTPRYLAARQKACQVREQGEWERARYIGFWVVKTVDAKNKFKRFSHLTEFPWEKPKAVQFTPLTDEEAAQIDEEMDAALKVLNPKAYEIYMAGKKGMSKSDSN